MQSLNRVQNHQIIESVVSNLEMLCYKACELNAAKSLKLIFLLHMRRPWNNLTWYTCYLVLIVPLKMFF